VAFHYPDFRYFLAARFFDRLAVEMLITAVSWQVYQLTRNPLHLGLVGLVQFAPFLLLFLVAGAAADRLPRRHILRGSITVQLLCAAAFLGLTLGGRVTLPAIFTILVFLGLARAFQAPVQMAIVPLLVPAEHFANAVAWSSAAFQTARIGGPAAAGALLLLGVDVVYAVVVAGSVASLVLVFRVRASSQVLSTEPHTWRSALAGLRFIWSHRVVLGAISLDLFAVLLGGATALLPIFAVEILGVGAVGFGALRAAPVVGALACMLILAQRPIRRRAGSKLLFAVGVFGAAICVFALSRSFWLSLAALFVLGAADAVSIFVRNNLVQIITPDEMRGRVSAVNSVFIGASNELGEFESGFTAAWWGAVTAVLVGGLATIGVAIGFALCLPRLRRVDSLDPDALRREHGEGAGAVPPAGRGG
jgi:NADH:ubiquinone oxidoreductase subunit K